jgi:hypothetical protein
VTVAADEVGQTVEVTDLNAHAWVEVFYDDIGWLFLEATPSGGGVYIPTPRPHTPAADNTGQESPETSPNGYIPDYIHDDYDDEDIRNGHTPGINTDNGSGTSNTQQGTEQSLFAWLHRLMITVAYIALVVLAIIARRGIMCKTREKNFKQANSNKAVIYMWRYIKRLGRREIIVPNDIEELALKARFSQHRMTEEERSVMAAYTNRLAYEISNGKGEYGRLWLKYVRALC